MLSGATRTSIFLSAIALCSSLAANPLHAGPAPFDAPFEWSVVPASQNSPSRAGLKHRAHSQEPIGTSLDSYTPSAEVMDVMTWVAGSDDNHDMPYIIVDKIAAQLLVFDSSSKLISVSPVLVGLTPGDDSNPTSGDRELSAIPLDQRTTPAGRFVAKFGRAAGGRNVLWVDYPDAISLHAVVTGNKKEHRLERLKSPLPEDHRITHGCINVPTEFYNKVVKPLFKDTAGVAYILPETKPLNAVFLGMPVKQAISHSSP